MAPDPDDELDIQDYPICSRPASPAYYEAMAAWVRARKADDEAGMAQALLEMDRHAPPYHRRFDLACRRLRLRRRPSYYD